MNRHNTGAPAAMIAYASRTGTKRNLKLLRRCGWRLLVSAAGVLRTEGFAYALDNGAWSAYSKGRPFDARAFENALRMLGAKADWTVIPDIVAGGLNSLELSLKWMRTVLDSSPRALIAVQDGMTASHIASLLGERVGIFVGGSTRWKLNTLPLWADVARQAMCWLHVGRVNTKRRIATCAHVGVDSFDGTSASRYAVTILPLDEARRQMALFGDFAVNKGAITRTAGGGQ